MVKYLKVILDKDTQIFFIITHPFPPSFLYIKNNTDAEQIRHIQST